MRLIIAAIGKARSSPEQVLCETYLDRARNLGPTLGFPKIDLYETDVSRAAQSEARRREEAKRLSVRLPEGTHLFVLDERAPSRSSENFAKRLSALRDEGWRAAAFIIGGPDGLDENLRNSAEGLAFGPQTWPHMLVRAMLVEQIYRTLSILAGHPYHRG